MNFEDKLRLARKSIDFVESKIEDMNLSETQRMGVALTCIVFAESIREDDWSSFISQLKTQPYDAMYAHHDTGELS